MRHKLHIKTGASQSEVGEVVDLKYMFRRPKGGFGFWFSCWDDCDAANKAASEAFGAENVTVEKGEEQAIVAPPVLKVSKKKATKKKATKKKE